jgi:Vesicle transport v-SNARE protein N-terminus
MSNPLDTDAGSELFSNYEAELKLVQADLNQKLDQIPELTGEERKSAIRGAERAVDEAKELVWFLTLPYLTPSPARRDSDTDLSVYLQA